MDILESGWHIEPPVLSGDECDTLLGTLAKFMMSIEAVTELANDGRLLQLAQTALNGPAVPFRGTLFAKSSL
jgi:hypothetical protein